jgi:putative hemolysin
MNFSMTRKILVGTAAVALGLAAVACGGDDDSNDQVGLANPASVFCVDQGGKVVIEDTADGQVGICEIDGQRVEEWEYYRANHESVGMANPAAVFCAEQGGETVGPEPMCMLPDGSEVDAWEYFRENQ